MFAFLRRLSFSFVAVLLVGGFATPVTAQSTNAVAASARVTAPVNPGMTARLSGHVPVYADSNKLPSTALDPRASFSHLTLVMSRAPEVEAAFNQLLDDQLNPTSPRFHQWLLPRQVGELYGPAQSDIDAVVSWLTSQGLTVTDISPNRLYIDFNGPVSVVSAAFGTTFRTFSLANGETRYSLTQEPAIPAAIAPAVHGIVGLSQSIHHSTARRGALMPAKAGPSSSGFAQPELNSTAGDHYLLAADFNTAYDINPVYAAGINGAGQNIAIVGLSRINALDISRLQSVEGLPTKQPNTIIPPSGTDPGAVGDVTPGTDQGAQDEATLDVTRTNGTAPGATLDLVVSGDVGGGATVGTDGLYIAINYAISNQNDPILSISFGGCESLNGSAVTLYENSLFQTAAAQGITTFISAGDDGAGACNAFSSASTSYANVLSINDLCATSYVTCVGGTEFIDTNPSTYWASSNSATNNSSLLSYVPEGAWNEIFVQNGSYSEGGGGGGVSTIIAEPSWQFGVGVPQTSFRWIPDVSFTSSIHDGYALCLNYLGATCGSFYGFGGTSAAAPSMAGIQALINQRMNARQGNINPTLYGLAANTTNGVYHDTTVVSSGVSSCSAAVPSVCNNSLPAATTLTGGLQGYTVATGWDAATGWGSMDVNKLLTAYPALVAFGAAGYRMYPGSPALTFAAGAPTGNTDVIYVAPVGGFTGTVNLSCSVKINSGTATVPPTCSMSATSVALTGTATANSTVVIGSQPQSTACNSENIAPELPWKLSGGVFAAFALILLPLRKRKAFRSVLGLGMLAVGMSLFSGCSSGTSSGPCPTHVVAGTSSGVYTVTVQGVSGGMTVTTSFGVTIQ